MGIKREITTIKPAKKQRKQQEKQRAKMGRPTKFDPSSLENVTRMCLLGYTDQQLAKYFDVSVDTIELWKKNRHDFLTAVQEGRENADSHVVKCLLKRALGYEFEEVRTNDLTQEVVTTTKHIAPDVRAAMWWLQNRQPDKWRNTSYVEHSVDEKLSSLMMRAGDRPLLPTQGDVIDVE